MPNMVKTVNFSCPRNLLLLPVCSIGQFQTLAVTVTMLALQWIVTVGKTEQSSPMTVKSCASHLAHNVLLLLLALSAVDYILHSSSLREC